MRIPQRGYWCHILALMCSVTWGASASAVDFQSPFEHSGAAILAAKPDRTGDSAPSGVMEKPIKGDLQATAPEAGKPSATETAGSASLFRRLPPGIDQRTREAIDRGLAYLARTQDRQGSWTNRAEEWEYPVAMTALAGLAMMMDGNTTTQGRYAVHVDRATTFLVRSSTPSGLIHRGELDPRPMHGHGFALLFLSQVLGVVESPARAEQIREVLNRGVALTAQSQSALGGWMYTPDARTDEGSVTVTQVQGLRSCRNVGIAVPKSVIDGAMEYLVRSQNSDGGIRYTAAQHGGPSRPAISAAAVCCWYNAGEYDNPRAKQALTYCKEKVRPQAVQGGHDYYAHLYMTQALYVSSDPDWDEYFEKNRDYLLSEQDQDGYWLGDNVGRAYGTAIALIILQLPYNQLPIMQR